MIKYLVLETNSDSMQAACFAVCDSREDAEEALAISEKRFETIAKAKEGNLIDVQLSGDKYIVRCRDMVYSGIIVEQELPDRTEQNNERYKVGVLSDMTLMLSGAVGNDYVEKIAEKIGDAVFADIMATSGLSCGDSYNDDDIRMSIGRVLTERLCDPGKPVSVTVVVRNGLVGETYADRKHVCVDILDMDSQDGDLQKALQSEFDDIRRRVKAGELFPC